MSVIPQTPQSFWGGGGALPPWAPYRGSALDPLGTVCSPQTPRLLTPPPLLQTLDPPLVTRLTRRMLLVEQELLTFPEHGVHPRLLVGFVLLDLYFFLSIVVCPFVLFFWPLCCLFFFDIRFLIAPLVSSNSS